MRRKLFSIVLVALLAHSAGVRSDPAPPPAAATLEVVNESGGVFTLTAADLTKLPQKELKVMDNSGDEATYAGVIPAEKRHSRWVKQVVRLTVRSDAISKTALAP